VVGAEVRQSGWRRGYRLVPQLLVCEAMGTSGWRLEHWAATLAAGAEVACGALEQRRLAHWPVEHWSSGAEAAGALACAALERRRRTGL
jgi:hypothetical protein